jgi:hypothetical protein
MKLARLLLATFAIACFAVSWSAVACSSSLSVSADAGGDGGNDGRPTDVAIGDALKNAADAASYDGPFLTALSVSASVNDASPPAELVPRFSPGVYDYYVRCAAEANRLTVSMTAAPGSLSLLVQPSGSPSRPKQTLSVNVNENQAVVAAATNGTATTEYWVRCLPPDFPQLNWVAHIEVGVPPPGYYMVGNWFPPVGGGGYAMMLNGNGVPVWYFRGPTGFGASDVDNVVKGAVSFILFSPTVGKSFEIHQLSPLSTTVLAPTGYATDLHELRLLRGNYLVFSDPLTFGVDLTGLRLPLDGGAEETLGPDSVIEDCAVVEFTPAGTVVWTWLASDHFDPAKDSTFPMLAVGVPAPDGGEVIDTFHCNSIDVDPVSGNLLVSARHMDSIFYIDRSTGKVLWKMGGPTASLDNATYVSVADPFFRQHDARFQPGWSPNCRGGSGQISVFDDETSMPAPARGVVYDVVVGAEDSGAEDGGCGEGGTAGAATVAWQYKGRITSSFAGSFRVSNDGSRVIGWGEGEVPGLAFTEVDVEGNDLVDFVFLDNSQSDRAIKVPLTAFDLDTLRSTAGLSGSP